MYYININDNINRLILLMTIAISVKVNDGIVLASDSATTIMGRDPGGSISVLNIYNYANKIFNLKKGLPIGAITWGIGSIGYSSISTLVKDFRKLISSNDDLRIDNNNYTIEDMANKFKKFIFDEKYLTAFKDLPQKPSMGFMIVGYSSRELLAEEWRIDIDKGECKGPAKVRERDEIGITWNGEIEAINRLIFGYSTNLINILIKDFPLPEEDAKGIVELCRKKLSVPFVIAPMPIQDAIDLTIFLVETTINFSRFAPGAPTVGGPIEVAAITKHEGFKWIQRKHYYDTSLNPKTED